MIGAQSIIWLLGGERLIRSSASVVEASRVAIATSTSLTDIQREQLQEGVSRFRRLQKDPETEAKFQSASVEHEGVIATR